MLTNVTGHSTSWFPNWTRWFNTRCGVWCVIEFNAPLFRHERFCCQRDGSQFWSVLTAASGISHIKFGNFDRKLFLSLLIPGIISAVLGAYVLSSLDTSAMRPLIQLYLILMGLLIILRSRGIYSKQLRIRPSLLGVSGWLLRCNRRWRLGAYCYGNACC